MVIVWLMISLTQRSTLCQVRRGASAQLRGDAARHRLVQAPEHGYHGGHESGDGAGGSDNALFVLSCRHLVSASHQLPIRKCNNRCFASCVVCRALLLCACRGQADDCDADADAVVQYCVVSDEYWPSLHLDSTITHHTRAARLQARYSDTFDSIKKPKKLEIAPQLGQVFLELDFDDGSTREFSVSPTQVRAFLAL